MDPPAAASPRRETADPSSAANARREPPDRSAAASPRREPADPSSAADAPAVVALASALGEDPLFASRTLRAFVRDGGLASIPARERKKRIVLRWLLDACFVEDRAYTEPEVNALLAPRHADVAALRRYLVDSGWLTRAGGEYRRPAR